MFIDRVTDLRSQLIAQIKTLLIEQSPFEFISEDALAEEGEERNNLPEVWFGEDGEANLYAITDISLTDNGDLYIECVEKYSVNYDEDYNDDDGDDAGNGALVEASFAVSSDQLSLECLAEIADILHAYKYPN